MTVLQECFDTNFEQHDSCARCFAQGFAFQLQAQILDKTTVAQCGLPCLIWSNKPVGRSVLHTSYLKQQIEVCWILLTTQTNLGKFIVALPYSFCQVVAFFTFLTKNANLQQFVVVHTVFHKYGKLEDVCTFLT